MLLRIGEFNFDILKHQLDTLEYSLELGFAKIEKINALPSYHNANVYSETYSINVTLLMQRQDTLDKLLGMAKSKKPLMMQNSKGSNLGAVIITAISLSKSSYTNNGLAMKQNLTLSLARYYGKVEIEESRDE